MSDDQSTEETPTPEESDRPAESVQPTAANSDVIPSGRPSGRGRLLAIIAASVGGLLVFGVAGIAFATYGYSRHYEGRILPGAVIAGIDVGGMTAAQARQAVAVGIRPELQRTITVTWKHRTWDVTPKELGARNNAATEVRKALRASADASFLEKAGMRVLGHDLGFQKTVAIRYPKQAIEGFVHGLGSSLDEPAADATLDYPATWVHVVPEKVGRKVRIRASVSAFEKALATNGDRIALSVKTVQPKVTTSAFKKVLLLHIGENKLYLYENGKITHTWTVATGQSIYPTPQGTFHIIAKVKDPEWINPAPDGWGKDMPASIPPGPDNPLGLRAMYWSSPGIRFHGIPTSELSSLGHNASHGCIRMSNADAMQLFDLVDVGTPILSIQTAPYS
jgi:lipoprotein-anchoring transpeptidase ErfK/SrfK